MAKTIVYNKLVRDLIPEIIEKTGKQYRIETLNDQDFLMKLNEKLTEECKEWLDSGDVEELADILEVIKALAESKGVKYEDVQKLRAQKAERRGGFEKMVLLIDVVEEP